MTESFPKVENVIRATAQRPQRSPARIKSANTDI